MVFGCDMSEMFFEQLVDDIVYIYQNFEEMFVEDIVCKDIVYYFENCDILNVDDCVDEIFVYLDFEYFVDCDGCLMSFG